MRATIKKLLFLIFLFFILSPKIVNAEDGWSIAKFTSNIELLNDGSVKVEEIIDVNFEVDKHGIYRDLPYIYSDKNQNRTYTEVVIQSVTQDGKNANIKQEKSNGYIRIRIGDPNITIRGNHVYAIEYFARGVLQSFNTYDEFYWNSTGNNWGVPIIESTTQLKSEENAILEIACYQGFFGSTEKCQGNFQNGKTTTFETTRALASNEGLTIVAKLKKGAYPITVIPKPKTFVEKFLSPFSLSTFLFSTLLGAVSIFILWLKKGRDFWIPGIAGYKNKNDSKIVKPIGSFEPTVVEYTPPENLPPAIIGVIMDEKADTLDVTATIIDLATRGFLTITEIPKKWMFGNSDYILKETRHNKSNLYSYEKELLTRLFTTNQVKISTLKKTFYDDLAKVKEKLYQDVVAKKFFEVSPEKIRTKYLLVAVFLIIISIVISIISANNNMVFIFDIALGSCFSGILLLIVSQFLPRRSSSGREIYRRMKGYRMFIERAEKYRQKFFESRNLFNEVLPYAIIFGITEKYAKALQDMGIKPNSPSWYHGSQAFNIAHFTTSISDFSNSVSNTIAATPSSNGFSGGSSGGGFSGGGGGSW